MFVLPDRKTLRNNMMGWHGLPEIYVVESQAICNYWNEWESLKMIISHFYVSTKRDQTKQSPHKTLIKSHPLEKKPHCSSRIKFRDIMYFVACIFPIFSRSRAVNKPSRISPCPKKAPSESFKTLCY